MPAQAAWFHRIAEILEQLHNCQAPYLDRLAVQKLFGVGERRARQIVAPLPAIRIGNAVAVERLALIRSLEQTALGEGFRKEALRRLRVAGELDRMRSQLAARRVRVPAVAAGEASSLADLAGTEFQPGELRIRFTGAEELAARLFALSQIMSRDWPAFVQAVSCFQPQG